MQVFGKDRANAAISNTITDMYLPTKELIFLINVISSSLLFLSISGYLPFSPRNIYILLKAIRAAATKVTIPAFLNLMNIAVAPPKAHAEWVDGNEELDGRFTSNSKAWSI